MFWKSKKNQTLLPKTPENTIIYAIGDIHGYVDLLAKMHQKIKEDVINSKAENKIVIYIGDYIDRGLKSKEVIDMLINNPLKNFKKIYLKGNHEDAMLSFLKNPQTGTDWLFWGGQATTQSYGVKLYDNGKKVKLEELSKQLKAAIPENHKKFYDDLILYHEEGGYLFVHAGLKPGLAISKQKEYDMLTIREDFIYSKKTFEKTVIFGHTIFDEPFNENGRIGIDTGAYAYGNLTCVVLEDQKVRFLKVN